MKTHGMRGMLAGAAALLAACQIGFAAHAASVAQIGEIGYASLQAAIDAAKDGETVTQLAEVLNEAVVIENKNITLSGVNITVENAAAIAIKGSVELTLEGENVVTSSTRGSAGVQVNAGAELTIAAASTGSLTASGGVAAAGIGSNENSDAGTITINGGTIVAVGGSSGAGIGGSNTGDGSVITITGGTVTASCNGKNGAGIGGGLSGKSGAITISGGNVTATGGEMGPGIGCGYHTYDGSQLTENDKITITGANTVVNATGGDGKSGGGAGIGSGAYGLVAPIEIKDGATVTAKSTAYGAGIGGGSSSSGNSITIDDATVYATGGSSAGIYTPGPNFGGGAGIGSGADRIVFPGFTIVIKNSTVEATGGNGKDNFGGGAGIGGGSGYFASNIDAAYGGDIAITDSEVTAIGGTGAEASRGAAGIGGGGSSVSDGGYSGNIAISGGKVTATGAGGGAGIGGGSKGGLGVVGADGTKSPATITVSGSDLAATGGADGEVAGAGLGAGNGGTNVEGCTVSVSCGTYSSELLAEYIADGYVLNKNDDGTYDIVMDNFVASVTAPDGTVTKYEDVTAALKEATGGNTAGDYTVTLLKDCTSGIITGFGAVQSVILDLNGKTLTIPTYFYVANDDTLTIKDGSAEKTGKIVCTSWGAISVTAPNGTLIVESGTLTHDDNFNEGYAPINQVGSGKVYITGGSVIAGENNYAIGSGSAGVKGGVIEINGGTVTGPVYLAGSSGVDTVDLNGGELDITFEIGNGFAGTITKAEGVEVSAPDGYKWGDDGKLVAKVYVAQIGETKYETIQDAADALEQDGTITLLADVSVGAAMTFNGGVTYVLDLAGHTLTSHIATGDGIVVANSSTLTLTSSGETAGVFTFTSDKNGSDAIQVDNNSTLNLEKNVTIQGRAMSNNLICADTADGKGTSTINLNGANIVVTGETDHDHAPIVLERNSVLNMTGGTISIDVVNTDTDKINVGGILVYPYNGRANLNGGKVIVDGNNANLTGLILSYYNGKENGLAVVDGTEFVINGKNLGTGYVFLNDIGGYAALEFKNGSVSGNIANEFATDIGFMAGKDLKIEISGGTFPVEVPEEFIADGYEVQDNNNGTYDVARVFVAQVGETKYYTLQEAIDVATNGETVTLLKDVAEKGAEVEAGSGEFFIQILDKSVVVDLGGFTLKGSFYLNSGAALTIDNGAIETLDGNASSCIESVDGRIVLGERLSAHSSVRHAIRVKGGTAEINGGTYVADGNSTYHVVNVSHASNVTINGGTFTSNKGNSTSGGNAVMIQDAASTVAIKGGTFTNAAGVEGCICAAAGLVISGGTFDTWMYDKYLAEGCWAFQKYNTKNLFFVAEKKDPPEAIVEKIDENPRVDVAGIGTVTLESTYNFKAPHLTAEEALESQYSTWHADFEVSVDKDIPANSIVLAGNYGDYDWLAYTNPDPITAGTTIRLLKDVGKGSMTYYELCTLVKEFKCGVTDVNGVLDGVNFTVKLNMYQTQPYTDANTTWNNEIAGAEPITSKDVTFELGSTRNYVAQFGAAKYETVDAAIEAAKAAPTEDDKKNVVTVLEDELEWSENFTYDDDVEIRLADDLDEATATAPSGFAWVGGVLMKPTNWLHVADTTWYNDTGSEFTLTTEEQLAGLAKLVNGGKTFAGKTVTLGADMNLAGLVWPGIGIYAKNTAGNAAFQGTFDGADKTVSGMTFADNTGASYAAGDPNNYRGLFNQIANGAVVENLTVSGDGFGTNPPSGEYGGAMIVGHAYRATIRNCVAEGSISGSHNTAGVVVRIDGSHVLACTNNAAVSGSYSKLGGIIAIDQAAQNSGATSVVDGCVNNGIITSSYAEATPTAGGIGGIIGWAQYYDSITVKNCTNNGEIIGGVTKGQIFGASMADTSIQGVNKGLATTMAVNNTPIDGLNFATVADDGVATYKKTLTAGETYLVTAPNPKPVITLAAGKSITFDQTLATIDPSGITAATILEKTTDGNLVTYKAKGYVVTIAWPDETTTTAEVADGEAFTLVAKAITGMTFVGWSGAYVSADAEAQITVTGDATITANYLPSDLYAKVEDAIEVNYQKENTFISWNNIVNLSLQYPTIQVGKDAEGKQFADVGIKLMKATTLKDETPGKPNWTPVKSGEPISAEWADDGETILIRLPAEENAQFFRFVPVKNSLAPSAPPATGGGVTTSDALKEALSNTETKKVEVTSGSYSETVNVPADKEQFVVKDGTFTPPAYNVAIYSQGKTDIVLEGGSYAVSEYLQIISAQTAGSKVMVNDGTYQGEWLVWGGRDVEVLITGGTFDLWGLVVADDSTNFKTTVTGGNFTLGDYGFDSNQPNEVVITGGTFNKDPTEYVPSTHKVTMVDGLYTVTAK